MKRIPLILLFTVFFSAISFADNITEGYYRVINVGLEKFKNEACYCTVNDGTININTSAGTSQYFDALQFYPGLDVAIPKPATVIYVTKVGNTWDIQAQGMSVAEKINNSSATWAMSGTTSACTITATYSGKTVNLWATDIYADPDVMYYKATTASQTKDAYKYWKLIKINNNDNYVAVKPRLTVTNNGVTKYYAPYYASYPFRVLSKGMKVFYVSAISKESYTLTQITSEIIPAATPVLIECASENVADNKIEPLYGSYTSISGNKLSGCYFRNFFVSTSTARTTFNPSTMRAWNVKDGKLVLSNDPTDYYSDLMPKATGYFLFANESYAKNLPTGAEGVLFLDGEVPAKVRTIQVDSASVTVPYGKTQNTIVTVTEKEAAVGQTVTASSSSTAVATVNPTATVNAEGKAQFTITPVTTTGGTAIITYSINGTNGDVLSAVTNVTVPAPTIDTVTVDKQIISDTYIEPHKKVTVTVTAAPDYASNGKTVRIESSDEAVAKAYVSCATLNASGQATVEIEEKGTGTATMTFSIDGATKKSTSTVTIAPAPVTSFSVGNNSIVKLTYGSSQEVTVTAQPGYAVAGRTVTAHSSDTLIAVLADTIATFNSAGTATFKIKSKNAGKAIITYTSAGKTATTEVTVDEPLIETLKLDNDQLTIHYDSIKTITVTALPKIASNGKTLTATSSNNNIAALISASQEFDANGQAIFKVHGTNAGHVTIRFTINGSTLKDSTAVTVLEAPIESITAEPSNITIPYAGTQDVTVTALPEVASKKKTVTVTSLNNTVVKPTQNSLYLDDNGQAIFTITGKAAGQTLLVFTVGEGATAHSDTTYVTVLEQNIDKVTVESKSCTLDYQGKQIVTVFAEPKEAACGKTVTAISSNSSVAFVRDAMQTFDNTGKATFIVEGVNIGRATISFAVGGTKLSDSTIINVPKPAVTSVKATIHKVTIEKDDCKDIVVTALPVISTKGSKVTATSSNSSIASVTSRADTLDANGQAIFTIKANYIGDAYIVYNMEGTARTDTTYVTVPRPGVTQVKVSSEELTVNFNASDTIIVVALPPLGSEGKKVSAASYAPGVAEVTPSETNLDSEGMAMFVVKAKYVGDADIVFNVDEVSATTKVHVPMPEIFFTVADTVTLEKGVVKEIEVKTQPAVITKNRTLHVASSDSGKVFVSDVKIDENGVATVSLTGGTDGKAIVTYSMDETDKYAQTTVTVLPPDSLWLSANRDTIQYNQNATITVSAIPVVKFKGMEVKAGSSNPTAVVAESTNPYIDANGQATFTIKALHKGDATLTFTVEGKTVSDTVHVHVPVPDITSVEVDSDNVTDSLYKQKKVTVTVRPAEGSQGKMVKATSSNPGVAATTEAEMILDEKGMATFTIESYDVGRAVITYSIDGVTYTDSTVVRVPAPPIISVELDATAMTITKDSTKYIIITTLPAVSTRGKAVQVFVADNGVVKVQDHAVIGNDGIARVAIKGIKDGADTKTTVTFKVEGDTIHMPMADITVIHADTLMLAGFSPEIEYLDSTCITISAWPLCHFASKTVQATSSSNDIITLPETFTLDENAKATVKIGTNKNKKSGPTNITFNISGTAVTAVAVLKVSDLVQAAMPTSDLETGSLFYRGKKVALYEETVGSTIYYTTDGSAPELYGKPYAGPIELDSTVVIKAIANGEKLLPSEPQTLKYTLAVNTTGIDLNAGWNWVSFNMTSDKLKSYDTMLSGTWADGDEVKDRSTFLDYFVKNKKWYGTMAATSEMENGNRDGMLKIHSHNSQDLDITGDAINPESSFITVKPGWNYIAYTPVVPLSVDDALRNYKPYAKKDDYIKSLNSGTATYNAQDSTWEGGLKMLEPGMGYMLMHSDSSTTAAFTYPVDYPLFPAAPASAKAMSLFSGNMNLVAVIDNDEIQEGDVIVATANGEVRGSATVNEDKKVVLTIAGDEPTDVTLTAEHDGEVIATAETKISYQTDAIIGSWAEPTAVTFVNSDETDTATVSDIQSVYGIDGKSYGNTKALPRGTYILKGSKGTSKVMR